MRQNKPSRISRKFRFFFHMQDNAGEKIQKGDLRWLSGEWREVVDTSGDRTVLQSQVGFYCRKR